MTGRNDRCPCGSGKKFKKCCLQKTGPRLSPAPAKGPFHFTSGSYGGPGQYMPSIACKRQTGPDQLEYHFVLVNPSEIFENEEMACRSSELTLEVAFREKQVAGSDLDFAQCLKDAGYLSVEDYRIVKEHEQQNG